MDRFLYVHSENTLRDMIPFRQHRTKLVLPFIPKFFLTGRTDQKSHRMTDAILSFIRDLLLQKLFPHHAKIKNVPAVVAVQIVGLPRKIFRCFSVEEITEVTQILCGV